MRYLFLKYNKVTNESFEVLAQKVINYGKGEVLWGDLSSFGRHIDCLNYFSIEQYLSSFGTFDQVFIGDIFWPTGQNICKWGVEKGVDINFLQHGQWIYIENKKNPKYLPKRTFVFGDKIYTMMKSWPYYKRSNVYVVGSPRYDHALLERSGEFVYFSPPVIHEKVPSSIDKINKSRINFLKKFSGLDEKVPLLIHPHYREGRPEYFKSFFPKSKIESSKKPVFDLLKKSYKILTHRDSTIVLDSIAHGKPVVLINMPDNDWSFFKRGYFQDFAKESNSLETCIKHLTTSEISYNDYIERAKPFIYLGDSSQRIIEIIG